MTDTTNLLGPQSAYDPSDEAAVQALDDAHLLAARECLQLWGGRWAALEVPPHLEIKFRVCYPLIAHSINHVNAALKTWDQFPLVAAASARVALEHSLTAQWVLLTHGAEETLVNHMTHSWMVRTQAFARATGTHDDLKSILDLDPVAGRDGEFSSQRLFDRFDASGLFYDLYRDLLQAVHPSYGTFTAHITISDEIRAGEQNPSRVSAAGTEQRLSSFASGTGLAAVLALDALERLVLGSPRLNEVADIANAAGLPHDLRYSDQSPVLQDPGSAPVDTPKTP